MISSINKILEKIQFQFLFFIIAALLVIRLIVGYNEGLLFHFVNDILVAFITYSLIINLNTYISKRNISPLTLVTSIAVINFILLIFFNFSELILSIAGYTNNDIINQKIVVINLIIFIVNLLLISFASYLFIVLKSLFFLRQKKNLNTYFKAMVIFILLASLLSVLDNFKDLKFIKMAFTANAVILIFVSSIRISWIAFLNKKQKRNLLLLAILLVLLFSFNLAKTSSDNLFSELITQFSFSLKHFILLINIYGIIYFSVLFFTTLFHLPTAEAIDRKSKEISSLQYFSKLINQVLDYKELTETIVEIAGQITSSSAAWIIFVEDKLKLPLVIKNISYANAEKISNHIFEQNKVYPIKEIKFYELKSLFKNNFEVEKFYNSAIVPLKTHNNILGYIFIANQNDILFDEDDKNTLETFVDYAAVALENSRLLKSSIEKERLERELDVAREMQKKLLPQKIPNVRNLEISSCFIPAFEVGGDYYDFFEIDNSKFGFTIADVSGKGTSAAFIMAEIKGIFESISTIIHSPKEILSKANSILKRSLGKNHFVSAAFGLIDFEHEKLFLSRAGHCPMILVRDDQIKEITPQGFGLGLNYTELFTNSLEEVEIPLIENDIIVLYTDGITEAKDSSMQDFGSDRLKKIIIENNSHSIDELSKKIITEVTIFSQNNPQHDDITLIIFRWKNKKMEN